MHVLPVCCRGASGLLELPDVPVNRIARRTGCACRVDFKTQDESGESSKEAQELVQAAQTIFQQGGEASLVLTGAHC